MAFSEKDLIIFHMLTQKELIDHNFIAFFESVNDPRVEGRCVHKLIDIIIISMCGILSGVESWVEMEDFGNVRKEWFEQFLELTNGIPSHDTFARVFSIIDASEFEKCFIDWCESISGKISKRLSFDGKSIRGTCRAFQGDRAVHLVNVYSHTNGLVLGQKVATGSGSSECESVIKMLDFLNVKNALISFDAGIAYKKVIDKIRQLKAHYLVPIKKNAKKNFSILDDFFKNIAENRSTHKEIDIASTKEINRGRNEKRYCALTCSPKILTELSKSYKDIKCAFRIIRFRESEDKSSYVQAKQDDGTIVYKESKTNLKTSKETVYYVSSKKLTPERALIEVRSHWQIENKLHRTLDVVFHEDACRVKAREAARNLSLLRKLAFNIIQKHPKKSSKKRKMKSAGWNVEFLEELLYYAIQ